MGVFSMFRRKAKDSDAASTAEAQAATLAAEPESEGVAGAEGSESPTEGAEAATADEKAAEKAEETEADETSEAAAAENVEIPKQQSAKEAADNDAADEGARK
ncbi:hypothetical protein ACIREE_21160 [Streptomyces sp. NPDC102467]|uniref:hypothetical protein n=1 Tax=Streptomyces sp. NPDC102467 TaxID=3366179 RepID=UPI0037FAB049